MAALAIPATHTLAASAGLPGTYQAWLADANTSPLVRSTKFGRYYTPEGNLSAVNWNDLVDGHTDIIINEFGLREVEPNSFVWTGTDNNANPLGPHCSGWTGTSGTGRVGNNAFTGTPFNYGEQAYASHAHLYCIQQ